MLDGWKRAQLKDVLRRSTDTLGKADEPTILTVTEGRGLVDQMEHWGRRIATENVSKYKIVRPNAVVYNVYLLWLGAIGLNRLVDEAITSPAYEVFDVLETADPQYLEYLVRSPEMVSSYAEISIGTVPRRRRTPWIDFLDVSFILPPLAVQRRIVDLIAAVDDAIDAAMLVASSDENLLSASVESMIANLQGETTELRKVMSIARGGSPRPIAEYETLEPDSIPWIKIGDIAPDGKYVTSTAKRIKPAGIKKSRLVQPGDFILSNSMSFGRPYIVKIEGCIHDGWLALTEFDESFTPDYLYLLLRSREVQDQFEAFAAGSGVRNLKKESVGKVIVRVPSHEVQKNIVDVTTRIRDSLEATRAYADSLRALRSNLLTVLLSGEHEIPVSYDRVFEGVA